MQCCVWWNVRLGILKVLEETTDSKEKAVVEIRRTTMNVHLPFPLLRETHTHKAKSISHITKDIFIL